MAVGEWKGFALERGINRKVTFKMGRAERIQYINGFVVFCKDMLNGKINSIDKFLKSTYFVVVYNGNIFNNSTFFWFIKETC